MVPGSERNHSAAGGLIGAVQPGSVADRLGIRPGCRLLAVNGQPLRDVVDYRFALTDGEISLLLACEEGLGEVRAFLRPGEGLGIEFAEPLFDGLRQCRNDCIFCFVKQLPRGLRTSLYVRDDDYRLSFLHGNFVTLTNLSDEDWQRILDQHLSPLYVSLHATSAEARAKLLGTTPQQAVVLDRLVALAGAGIELHLQVVVVPGVNDGAVLEQTFEDLLHHMPEIGSVAIVPVGMTKFAAHPDLRLLQPAEAREVLSLVRRYRKRARAKWGHGVFQAADELFLLAGEPVPAASYYEGYPQLENGVGLVRQFLDEWARFKRRANGFVGALRERLAVVTGALMAPIWRGVAAEMRELGAQVEVVPVENRALGTTITVAGLLFACDVIEALRKQHGWERAYLPASMFDAELCQTLDGHTAAEVAAALGKPVCPARSAAEVLRPLPA